MVTTQLSCIEDGYILTWASTLAYKIPKQIFLFGKNAAGTIFSIVSEFGENSLVFHLSISENNCFYYTEDQLSIAYLNIKCMRKYQTKALGSSAHGVSVNGLVR